VYIHLKEDTLEPFYVGKGKGERAFRTWNRNAFWKNVVNKHGYLIKIIYEGISEEEAFALEKETISNLKEIGVTLTNLTNGGDGVSGHKHSEESKKKMSEAKKGKPNLALKGKEKSPEHKERLRQLRLGAKQPCTEETRLKIIEAKKGKPLMQVTCPHCNKEMSKALVTRYNHIEKCKGLSNEI
jgi:hypothetical protein